MSNFLQLVFLGAVWGASFLFMRVAAIPLGPAVLIEGRVFSAAIVLSLIGLYWRKNLNLMRHPKHFLILGVVNTGLPFLLFAYAAQTLNVSTLAILNSTAPIWSAIIGAVWNKTKLSLSVMFGLMLGVIGVAILVGWDAVNLGANAIVPIIAGAGAAFCYGLASNYASRAPSIEAYSNAHGNMWAAVIVVLPLIPFLPAPGPVDSDIVTAVLLLGVLCTAIAYLIYFNLVAKIGPSSTLSVTFLIPIFGIIWGNLFLGEPVGINTLIGGTLVMIGTMYVTGFSPKMLLKRKTG
ncbi:MAG: DMT family transporter [Psychrobium sp.]